MPKITIEMKGYGGKKGKMDKANMDYKMPTKKKPKKTTKGRKAKK